MYRDLGLDLPEPSGIKATHLLPHPSDRPPAGLRRGREGSQGKRVLESGFGE